MTTPARMLGVTFLITVLGIPGFAAGLDSPPSAAVIAMPEDRMAVSIAVTADGRRLLDEQTTTLPNGFIDLWLPRGLEIDVTIEARGLRVTQRIGTLDTDPTCITTAKLHY
jgi:hypothetical protein